MPNFCSCSLVVEVTVDSKDNMAEKTREVADTRNLSVAGQGGLESKKFKGSPSYKVERDPKPPDLTFYPFCTCVHARIHYVHRPVFCQGGLQSQKFQRQHHIWIKGAQLGPHVSDVTFLDQ